jgi:myosin-5
MAHTYEVGTKAWQPDATEGWVASELVSKTQDGDKYILVFDLANGEVRGPRSSHALTVSFYGSRS